VTALAEALDPDGRRVVLDGRGWAHVLAEHGEMEPYREAVIATVRTPQHRRPDPRPAASLTGVVGSVPAAGCWWS